MNLDSLRMQFPALNQKVDGVTPVFLDGPGGAQAPQSVLTAMTNHLGLSNSNLGGPFFTSRQTDDLLIKARDVCAAFVNAHTPAEIVFGANMTSLTFSLSRAISRHWQPGDEIIITAMDHDANVSPWVHAAADKGATIHKVNLNPEDCTLDMDHFEHLLSSRTKVVAFTLASNATGTITNAKDIVQKAKSAGALTYVDAVHYAAHRLPDVQALGCDFLALSAYKFCGPHVGFIYGQQTHLEYFTPYKVSASTEIAPNRWETGTQNFEGLSGLIACIEYLASLGEGEEEGHLRARLIASYEEIQRHEENLGHHFLDRAKEVPGLKIFGVTAADQLAFRTPTFGITITGHTPQELATHLGNHHVCTWHGHFYALGVVDQLGLTKTGGLLRIGCLHYNTTEELDQFFEVLAQL